MQLTCQRTSRLPLVGSLSGQPISRLVAGPLARLIEDQIAATAKKPETESGAAGALPIGHTARVHAYPTSSALAPSAAEDAAGYRPVVEAYREF